MKKFFLSLRKSRKSKKTEQDKSKDHKNAEKTESTSSSSGSSPRFPRVPPPSRNESQLVIQPPTLNVQKDFDNQPPALSSNKN